MPSDESLQSGSVKGLRARNGFYVSFNWQQGKVENIRIHSNNGLPCYILLPDNFTIKDQQGKTIEYKKDGDAIVFETKRNALYSIMIK